MPSTGGMEESAEKTVLAFRRRIAGMADGDRFMAKAVFHAAPVVMGLKPAALFCPGGEQAVRDEAVREYGGRVGRCLGLEYAAMRTRRGDALALVHCPALLDKALASAEARELLAEAGYGAAPGEAAVIVDAVRARCLGDSFPHEIGLLLGYPAGDVRCFMRRGRKRGGCGACGRQVYGDWDRAAERSRLCRAAKLLAARLVLAGVDWEELGAALADAGSLRNVV